MLKKRNENKIINVRKNTAIIENIGETDRNLSEILKQAVSNTEQNEDGTRNVIGATVNGLMSTYKNK